MKKDRHIKRFIPATESGWRVIDVVVDEAGEPEIVSIMPVAGWEEERYRYEWEGEWREDLDVKPMVHDEAYMSAPHLLVPPIEEGWYLLLSPNQEVPSVEELKAKEGYHRAVVSTTKKEQ